MTLGFIGCGKMASALVGGIVQSSAFLHEQIVASDAYPEAASKLAAETGIKTVANNDELASASQALVLCVKPLDAVKALQTLAPGLGGKLVISIVAGLSLESLQAAAGAECRVIRVMPNTPALIGKGAAAYALGATATPEDGELAEKIFRAVGQIHRVPEYLLDAVTGLSGSGPAYVYTIIEALADGGVLMGLPRGLALQLAAQTVAGAAEMVLQGGEHPAALRDAVTSPGGTTIAGLEALEQRGLRAALMTAVRAATERSKALGRPA
jgi:pyrroline-5-carboxylate reductase